MTEGFFLLLRADAATNVKGRKTKINEEEFLLSLQRKIPRLKMLYIYIAIRRLQEIVFLQRESKERRISRRISRAQAKQK